MTTLINRPNLRCRKLAWMRESVWAWYMPLTDWMDDLMPALLMTTVKNLKTVSFGFGNNDWEPEP